MTALVIVMLRNGFGTLGPLEALIVVVGLLEEAIVRRWTQERDGDGIRDFTATVPDTKMVGGRTYLQSGSGWLYLATVIDLETRMVVAGQWPPTLRTSAPVGQSGRRVVFSHLKTETYHHYDFPNPKPHK